MVLADLNADGKLDIAVTQTGSNIFVLLGTGTGSFGAAVAYPIQGEGYGLALGDFNGDGAPDLAAATYSHGVSVLLGSGTGSFGAAVNYSTGSWSLSIIRADLNDDGIADLATANTSSATTSVLLGTGSGTFNAAVNYAVGFQPYDLALGDVSGDGTPDLVVVNNGTSTLSVLAGNGAGTFQPAVNCPLVPGAPNAIALGDLSSDGKPDLVVASGFLSASVSLLVNTSPDWPFTFTDDFLLATTLEMKAVHVAELRSAINTLRGRQALPNFEFTDAALTPGTSQIRGVHIVELRDALKEVYDSIGRTRPAYTDPSIAGGVTLIKRVHIDQIRAAARAADWFNLATSRSGAGSGTITSTPAGINCGTDCTEGYRRGTVVTLAATPASGSPFAGWSGACSGTGTCQVTMTADRTVTAAFALPLLTVGRSGNGSGTVTSNPAGINCGVDCTESYAVSTSVVLTATAASGSTFLNWTGACSGTGACNVTMNANVTVGAVFTVTQPFTLTVTKAGSATGTVTSSPAGIDCGGDCSEIYFTGNVVTLTASAPSGSYFANWTGACSGGGTCTVTMNSNLAVGATFNTFTIDIDPVRGTVQMPNKYRTGAWGVGGGQFVNYVLVPPGWTVGGESNVNYVSIPPSAGWTMGGGGYNNVGLGPGWSASRGSNGPNNVALPSGWSTYGGLNYPHVVAVPPGWTYAGSLNSSNLVSYPTTDVATLEIAFNDPGWIAWFQALKTGGVMSDSDIADVVIYVLGGGGNSRRWNNNTALRTWGWQGAAPSGQWP